MTINRGEIGIELPDYLRAVEQGYIPAIHAVAEVDNNLPKTKAKEMLTYCANQGYIPSICTLGRYYLEGRGGIEKNEKKAVEFFQIAANAGHMWGRYYLANCYRDGIGIAKDVSQARHWYRLAREQGHPTADRSLTELGSGSSCVVC